MAAKARFTQADVTRALKGVQSSGHTPTKIVIHPSGEIAVHLGDDEIPQPNEWVDLE